jgi:hypothetical protein
MQERFGTDRLAFKEQLLRAASRKKALYPNFAAGASAPLGVPIWTSIGPTSANSEFNAVSINGVDSGRMRTILPDPGSPDTVYVLTSGGGLWKTTNFTQTPSTWVPKTDALITTGGGSAAFGRITQTLYLGLGDPFDDFPLVGGFMVKSTDGGDNWSAPISLTNATSVRDVKIDTTTPSDIVLVATDAGLFRSIDGGANYSAVASGAGQAFNGLEVWSLAKTSAGWLASAVDVNDVGSLFISTDRGATWNPITNAGNVFTGAGRTTLGVGLPGDSIVYAFADVAGSILPTNVADQLDLFRSTNGGQNWTALGINSKAPTNQNPDQPDMDLMHDQAWYNQMVLVDPMDTNRNTVYLGGNLSSAKTTNGGVTWTLTSNWLPDPAFGTGNLPYVHADFHAAAFRAGTIFFGSDGGLFVSADGGTTWASNKNVGLVTHLAYSITSNPTAPSSVITGMQDDGTRVREGSSTIYDQTIGGDGFGVGTSQDSNLVTLGSVFNDDIFSSSDLGFNWVSASNGLDQTDAPFFTEITSPVASADNSGKVFFSTGNHNIYETTDGAANWGIIGATGSGGISSNRLIRPVPHAVGVSPTDTSHIGVAANGGVVLITSNGGTSWTEEFLDAQVPGYLLNNANVAWANNTVVYACSEDPTAGAVRVARSGDGGSHWLAANGGFPDISVSKLQVDPRDSTGNTVYAATFAGVYQTTNGGTSWHLFGAGLPDVHVTDMYMPADGSFLRVSTFGRGIWEINLSQPTHFQVAAPASSSAGASFNATVTALDASGNTVPNYLGTVHFTSSDPAATLPADYTFVSADSGSHTFSGGAALGTPGSQTITATDTLASSLTGFATISVTSGPATHFTVAASPTSISAGNSTTVTVTAFDAFNHAATGYRGTIHFTSSDAQATLPADYTFATADNGAHGFPGVILKTAGNPSITVRDTGTASISGSTTVMVTAATATKYSITVPPTVTAGTAFTVRLVAQDQFNNTDHGYLGTVHFTSSDPSPTKVLPADYPFVAADNGIKLFTNALTLQTNGTQSITATDTTTASVTATVSTQVLADLPLTGVGRTIRLRSGIIPVVVATFTDGDSKALPADFSVSILWGDGTPADATTAIITQPGGPGTTFMVTATHFYARKGIFAVQVTVTDHGSPATDAGGSILDINSTASFFPRTFSF